MSDASTKPVVVIHTNDRQWIPALVGAHSLKSRSRHPDLFDVRLLRLEEVPHLYNRHNQSFLRWEGEAPALWRRDHTQSFGPLRRLVPALLGFRGRALVIDPDVFAIGDVWDLLGRDMGGKAILCRQKPFWRDGRRLHSTAVMLLDCSRLTHWRWERDVDDLFAGRLALDPWLSLFDEDPARIGLFEHAWNDHDTLTEETKLLHNTRIATQPWKTGLPADYGEYAAFDAPWLATLKRIARRIVYRETDRRPRYQPHPDPRQERLFFTLLRECLDAGSITPRLLRRAMRKNDLRRDAFALLARCTAADAPAAFRDIWHDRARAARRTLR